MSTSKNGKLFGVINLLDLLIILIVLLAVAFAGVYFMKGRGTKTDSLGFTYTIEVTEQDPEYFNYIKPGEAVENGQTKAPMGKIVSFESYPSQKVEADMQRGEYRLADLEGKLDGRITIACDTATVSYPDIMIDKEAMKVGKQFALRSESAAMRGYVVAMDYNEEEMGGNAK